MGYSLKILALTLTAIGRKYIKKQANFFSVENNMVSLKYKSKHLLSLLVVKKRKL
jgi:hypothetical protein